MIRKSGRRFSDQIMLEASTGALGMPRPYSIGRGR